jgi:predicted PilT family ATPase
MTRVIKDRLVEIVEHAPKVIGVAVREDDMGHILGRNAKRLERFAKAAGTRLKVCTRAHIKQHRVLAIAKQRHVAIGGELFGAKIISGKDRCRLFRRQIANHHAARQHEITIAQGVDLIAADRHARLRPDRDKPACRRDRRAATPHESPSCHSHG